MIVRPSVLVIPPTEAEIVEVVSALTDVVLTVNVAEVLPAGIVTVAGTVAEDRLLDSEITNPPVGAGDVMLTVPVLDLPPFTELGLSDKAFRAGAKIVRVAVAEAPFKPALIVAAT